MDEGRKEGRKKRMNGRREEWMKEGRKEGGRKKRMIGRREEWMKEGKKEGRKE